jgi:hypothetical protein
VQVPSETNNIICSAEEKPVGYYSKKLDDVAFGMRVDGGIACC